MKSNERLASTAARSRQAVEEELKQLLTDLEELGRRVGDAADPELDLLRARVRAAIISTRQAIESRSERPVRRAREAFYAGRTYLHERPWRVAGMASLLGMAVGVLLWRRYPARR